MLDVVASSVTSFSIATVDVCSFNFNSSSETGVVLSSDVESLHKIS